MADIFSGLRGNDTHKVIACKDTDTLILISLDDDSKIEVGREQLGNSLRHSNFDTLVFMGVRVLKQVDQWEIAKLYP